MRELRFLAPENLDLEKLVDDNKEFWEVNKLKASNVLYVCDSLTKVRSTYRKKMEEDNDRFCPLSSAIFDRVIYKYKLYLQLLFENDILDTDNHFILGEKCRGYCFTDKYCGVPLKEHVIEDSSLYRSIQRESERQKAERKKNTWGYGYLTQWWHTEKLDIDQVGASNWVDAYVVQKLDAVPQNVTVDKWELEYKKAVDTSIDFKYHITSIKKKRYKYKFAGDGHRFYSPITNLKKELRSFLTYDGKPLVDIDIKNSQPFLSLCLFDQSFWSSRKTTSSTKLNLERLNEGIYSSIRKDTNYKAIITLVKSSESCNGIDSSVNNFRELVLDGQLYEYIKEHFEPLFPKKFRSRTETKVEVLKMFYSDTDLQYHYKPCNLFQEHFPKVHELFNRIRWVQNNFLPVILQRIESFLVIDVICKEINKLYPDIPLFTIHDNILTTVGNEVIVKEIMEKEICKWTGYIPALETTYYIS